MKCQFVQKNAYHISKGLLSNVETSDIEGASMNPNSSTSELGLTSSRIYILSLCFF